jgi:hypothetical protein
MRVPSIAVQSWGFGAAAAGLSFYGASAPDMSDRARIVTAGMAGVFGAASALSGFKVWAAINVGVAAGTLAALGADHLVGGDDAARAAREVQRR